MRDSQRVEYEARTCDTINHMRSSAGSQVGCSAFLLAKTEGPHLHAHADAADPHAHVAAQPRGVKGAGVRLNGDLRSVEPRTAWRGLDAAWHGMAWHGMAEEVCCTSAHGMACIELDATPWNMTRHGVEQGARAHGMAWHGMAGTWLPAANRRGAPPRQASDQHPQRRPRAHLGTSCQPKPSVQRLQHLL